MQYLIIMGALIAVAVVLIVVIIIALMKGKQEDEGDYEEEVDAEEYKEEEAVEQEKAEENPGHKHRPAPEHRGRRQDEGPSLIGQGTGAQDEGEQEGQEEKRIPGKKLWKLVLENLGNWQKSTFVFYENIGIGRGQGYPQFEKFMTISGDPRISKLHCAIIQKDGKLYLKDMGSRNGTYLNGRHISQPVLLQREDVIGVGETEIEVQSMMREKD